MRNLNSKISLAVLTGIIMPTFSFAACNSSGNGVTLCEGNVDVADIIVKVTKWVLGITGAVAVLLIIWGGFQYITAAGNEKRVESAKQTLTYAVIGLIVILLAQVIVTLVGNTLQGALTAK